MRVLWFTGAQLPALTGFELFRVGWQEGLRKSLERYCPDIELSIACFASERRDPLTVGNATYHTIPRILPRNGWERFKSAWQHNSFTPEEINRCRDLVDQIKPDLVHIHGTENAFVLDCKKMPVPVVISLQAIVNGYYPFLFSDLSWSQLLKKLLSMEFLKGYGIFHKWLTWAKYRKIEQDIYRSCSFVIGRTEWDRSLIAALSPQTRYFHCDEVLNDRFYDIEWKNGQTTSPIIYSTTSNAFFKGGLLLVEAMKILQERGYKDICLRMGGIDLQSELGVFVADFIHHNHLENSIQILGRLSPQQIVDEMLHAGLFTLPTHIDNSPNSLCEAMVMGMPIVATHVGGVPTLLTDRADGLLCHDRDPYMLADKMIQLVEDRIFANRLGAQARKTALLRHDRQKIAERTKQIYQSILAG